MSKKPIMADLPFPSIEGLTEDYKSAMIISPAYADKTVNLKRFRNTYISILIFN